MLHLNEHYPLLVFSCWNKRSPLLSPSAEGAVVLVCNIFPRLVIRILLHIDQSTFAIILWKALSDCDVWSRASLHLHLKHAWNCADGFQVCIIKLSCGLAVICFKIYFQCLLSVWPFLLKTYFGQMKEFASCFPFDLPQLLLLLV